MNDTSQFYIKTKTNRSNFARRSRQLQHINIQSHIVPKMCYESPFLQFLIFLIMQFLGKSMLGKKVNSENAIQSTIHIYLVFLHPSHLFFENRTSSNRHETVKQPAADTASAACLAIVLPCSPNKNLLQKFNIFCHYNDTYIHTQDI